MPMELVSEEIIRKAAQGDLAAFEEIYKACAGFVYNVAFRVAGTKEDAEEIVQDTFMKMYRALQGFEFRSSFKTWVYRVAMNTALNRYQQMKRLRTHHVEFDPALEETVAAPHTETPLERKDAADELQRMLGRLNPDQKACLVLREIEGLSYEEIAETLKININTVRTRIMRARQALLAGGHKGGQER